MKNFETAEYNVNIKDHGYTNTGKRILVIENIRVQYQDAWFPGTINNTLAKELNIRGVISADQTDAMKQVLGFIQEEIKRVAPQDKLNTIVEPKFKKLENGALSLTMTTGLDYPPAYKDANNMVYEGDTLTEEARVKANKDVYNGCYVDVKVLISVNANYQNPFKKDIKGTKAYINLSAVRFAHDGERLAGSATSVFADNENAVKKNASGFDDFDKPESDDPFDMSSDTDGDGINLDDL